MIIIVVVIVFLIIIIISRMQVSDLRKFIVDTAEKQLGVEGYEVKDDFYDGTLLFCLTIRITGLG